MTYRLATNYAKNYCNWTLTVKVIVENVVTCFFGTQCSRLQRKPQTNEDQQVLQKRNDVR